MREERIARVRAAIAATACAAALALGLWGAAAAPAATPSFGGPLRVDGHRFVDPMGRTVILHGIFAVWKSDPLYPSDDPTDPNQFLDEDAANIAEAGFDLVRLAWYWEGLEPTQGTYSPEYLDGIAAVEDKLANHDVYTLLDAHQDQYNRTFGDKPGFPVWATVTDELTPEPLPFPVGYFKPATARAFANLYANTEVGGEGIADAFADAWRHVAARFTDRPMTLGYDLVNEPFPGTFDGWDTSCNTEPGCPAYDRNVAQPFQNRLARAIRDVDTRRPVFYEPSFFFNSGNASNLGPAPADVRPAGFSFHGQCSTHGLYQATGDPIWIERGHEICPPEEIRTMHNAQDAAERIGGPPLMTEVTGTGSEDDQELNCLLERADHFQTGFTFGMGPGRLRFDDLYRPGAPFQRKVLSRVYPRAIAGDPEDFNFDVRTGRFHLEYETSPSAHGRTVIAVPPVQYSDGYEVEVSGAKVTSAPNAELLEIANGPNADRVEVKVIPRPGDTTSRPAFPECMLDDEAPPEPEPKPERLPVRFVRVSPHGLNRALRERAITVRLRCGRACTARVRLRLSPGRARALGLVGPNRNSPLTIARGDLTEATKGRVDIEAPVGGRALEALAKRRGIRTRVVVKVSEHGAAGKRHFNKRLRMVRGRGR